ncbi:MAG: hypothetical protein M5U34_17245 [Chloroflexi bacterium]|nr:hypothetical protein [Chloroflexota bacterium]
MNLLQRRWRWVTAVYLITLFTFFLLLRNIQPSLSTRWLTLASVTAVTHRRHRRLPGWLRRP